METNSSPSLRAVVDLTAFKICPSIHDLNIEINCALHDHSNPLTEMSDQLEIFLHEWLSLECAIFNSIACSICAKFKFCGTIFDSMKNWCQTCKKYLAKHSLVWRAVTNSSTWSVAAYWRSKLGSSFSTLPPTLRLYFSNDARMKYEIPITIFLQYSRSSRASKKVLPDNSPHTLTGLL